MSTKEKMKKLQEILHDENKCNAEKFEEMEQIVLEHMATEEH